MGTSTNYSASPNWKTTKQQVTQAGGDGFVTPKKAGELVAAVVSQMAKEPSLGFGGSSRGSGGGGAGGSASGGAGGGSGGGSRRGSNARPSGGSIRGVASGLGHFLSEVQKIGFAQALADHGLTDLSGKSPDEIALELADLLCEPASLIDDTVLRDALIDMMMEWSEGNASVEELGADVEVMASDINGVLHELMGHYIYQVFKSVGYQGLLKNHGPEAADGMCGQIKDYIDARISDVESNHDLSSIDWNGQDGAGVVDGIVSDTIDLFGGTE